MIDGNAGASDVEDDPAERCAVDCGELCTGPHTQFLKAQTVLVIDVNVGDAGSNPQGALGQFHRAMVRLTLQTAHGTKVAGASGPGHRRTLLSEVLVDQP